jgi:competence protein ComEC
MSGNLEKEFVREDINVDSNVLKVAHHGSKYSTSEEFLQNVNPEIAVISVGAENSYGHPTPETLQRLEKFGIKIFRTDKDGTVEVSSDGENIFAHNN